MMSRESIFGPTSADFVKSHCQWQITIIYLGKASFPMFVARDEDGLATLEATPFTVLFLYA